MLLEKNIFTLVYLIKHGFSSLSVATMLAGLFLISGCYHSRSFLPSVAHSNRCCHPTRANNCQLEKFFYLHATADGDDLLLSREIFGHQKVKGMEFIYGSC
ncbi:hypothetical protein CEXT_476571 [Caerostris extrusa]|uniref:Uncharacterized protein n=1 Tax=Caerostris extrusa TaxID=172846 RepID=A0AAV4UDQ5_CAEEX|nr:hypothetical protein CEXT_476571 [Caerostris extrusa]